MSDPLGALLEGGLSGFETVYGLREGAKERKRRTRFEEALERFRLAEGERRLRTGAREEAAQVEETGLDVVPSRVPQTEFTPPTFGPDAAPPDELRFLRTEVGRELGGFGTPALPAARMRPRIEFGGVEQVGTPRAAVEEIGYDASISTGDLAGDIARARQPTMAQQVGKALGSFTGRDDLTPVQQTLLGRGAVPLSALQPKRYAPATREEWLRDQRDLAALRVGSRATKEDLTAVERQIDDTRAELAAAERRRPKKPLVFVRPEDETAFGAAESEADEVITALQQRMDSLNVVRDALAAELQGGRGGGAGADPRLQRLEEQYRAALDRGVDPARARERYEQERRRLLGERGGR